MNLICFLLILILGLFLRLYRLDFDSFGLDEMVSLHFSHQPDPTYLTLDTNPPLYHLILKFWLWVTPIDEFWSRLPSVLFSVLNIFFVIRLSLTFLTGIWVFLPPILIALSPLSILQAQDVRMYALFEVLSTLSLYSLSRADLWREGLKTWWASASLAFMSHLFGFFILVSGSTLLFLRALKEKNRRQAILIPIFLGALTALALLLSKQDLHHLDWQQARFLSLSLTTELAGTISMLFNGHLAFSILLVGLFIVTLIKRRGHIPANEQLWIWVLLAPVIGLTFLSWIQERSLLLPRYLLFSCSLPPLLLASYLNQFKWHKAIDALLFCFLVAMGSFSLFSHKGIYLNANLNWREALLHVKQSKPDHIFTTRSEAIRTPYLSELPISVERISPETFHLEQLKEQLRQGQKVFFIDNVYGARNYWGTLLAGLQAGGIPYKEKYFYWKENQFTAVLTLEISPPDR